MKRLIIVYVSLLLFSCSRREKYEPYALFPIKEYGKWGYINANGKKIIQCQFDWAGKFSEGLAPILKDTLYGFIDTLGKVIIEPKFYRVEHFSDGLCYVTLKKDTTFQFAFINTNGNIAFITPHKGIAPFSYNRAAVSINDEVCFIDKTGKVVINTHFPYGSGGQFHDGIAMVWGGTAGWVEKEDGSKAWEGDTTKYIDTTGNPVIIVSGMGYDDFSEGLTMIPVNGKRCYVDKTGKSKICPERQDLYYRNFSDGMAEAIPSGYESKSGFIDTTGKLVIPIIYDFILNFNEGLAAYEDTGKWGFIDKKGKIAIKPQFDYIEFEGFKNGLCKVKQDHQWGYINKNGEYVWKEQIGIQYEKLDYSKWDLDSFTINAPLFSEIMASDNIPRKKHFKEYRELTLSVDTVDLTVFQDKYFGYKVYLINSSVDTIRIPAQDGRIKLIQQALNSKGEWQDIENFMNSFCGNSYHTIKLLPDYYQTFACPIYRGAIKTRIRLKLELYNKSIYSNSFTGKINKGQFLDEKNKDKTTIGVWANGGHYD